jgi:hypothetical protein
MPSSSLRSAGTLSEALACLALGFSDGLRPRLAFASAAVAAASVVMWLLILVLARGPVWSAAEAAALWALPQVARALSGMVAFLLVATAFVLMVVVTIRVYQELFLMTRIQRQCLLRYPAIAATATGSWAADLRSMLRQFAVLLLSFPLLLVPLIGSVAYLLLGCYLNVRGLVDDALENLATPAEREAIVQRSRGSMVVLGLAMAALLLIPFAGLLMPSILGASVCHLCLRALTQLRLEHHAGHPQETPS